MRLCEYLLRIGCIFRRANIAIAKDLTTWAHMVTVGRTSILCVCSESIEFLIGDMICYASQCFSEKQLPATTYYSV